MKALAGSGGLRKENIDIKINTKQRLFFSLMPARDLKEKVFLASASASAKSKAKNLTQRVELLVNGTVQAVGFRPFVYRLATQYQLSGSVRNVSGAVHIEVEGQTKNIHHFQQALIKNPPPLAKPEIVRADIVPTINSRQFIIEKSISTEQNPISIPADYYVCEDCLAEMQNQKDRRYQYPLISCTQCGPRYTIIDSLPYDRENTSLKNFTLCPACSAEYTNPSNRRYHAETISCHDCGPQLSYCDQTFAINKDNQKIIAYAVDQLKSGKILAIKGIGGYHLVCDAFNQTSINQLRQRKHRPDKPFAVMFPLQSELKLLKEQCEISESQLKLLCSPQRPIVLLQRSQHYSMPTAIAPKLERLGVLLPYSPLHTLISQQFNGPLIVTSGNLSGEPVITDNQLAEDKLGAIADGFLHHNRPILRAVDDAVYQFINGQFINGQFIKEQPQVIRLGRGLCPLELTLPTAISAPSIALGALFKNTVAFAWQNRLVISPHIGDMDSPSSLRAMENTLETLQKIYQIKPEELIHDAHPGYSNTRWAKKQLLPASPVYHHHAHASALAFEQPQVTQWLMFTWDGVGLGDDNTIWGGETFIGSPGNWQRISSLKPFFLAGGEMLSRKPRLSALSLAWETGKELPNIKVHKDLFSAWQRRINAPQSTAMARLFDAAAAILGLIDESSYDGHAPMLLEAVTTTDISLYVDLSFTYQKQRKLWEIDWQPLLGLLLDKRLSIAQRATAFHVSLAKLVLKQVESFQLSQAFTAVGFSGGVFQNQRLCYFIGQFLDQQKLPYYFHQVLPSNDAAICVGQVMEMLYQQRETKNDE